MINQGGINGAAYCRAALFLQTNPPSQSHVRQDDDPRNRLPLPHAIDDS